MAPSVAELLARLTLPQPGTVYPSDEFERDLLAIVPSLVRKVTREDLKDLCSAARAFCERIERQNDETRADEQALATFDAIVREQLDAVDLAQWRIAVEGPYTLATLRDEARRRQATYEKSMARATTLLASYAGGARFVDVEWGSIAWSTSAEFAAVLLRAIRHAARVGSDGAPRPGPPLTARNVLDRLDAVLASAGAGRDSFGSSLLKKACAEAEKADDKFTTEFLRKQQDAVRAERKRVAAFEASYAGQGGAGSAGGSIARRPKKPRVDSPAASSPAQDAEVVNSEGGENLIAAEDQDNQDRVLARESLWQEPDEDHAQSQGPALPVTQLESSQHSDAIPDGDDAEDVSSPIEHGVGISWNAKGKWKADAEGPVSTTLGKSTFVPPPSFAPMTLVSDISDLVQRSVANNAAIREWRADFGLPAMPSKLLDIPFLPPAELSNPAAAPFLDAIDAKRNHYGLDPAAEGRRELEHLDRDELVELLLAAQLAHEIVDEPIVVGYKLAIHDLVVLQERAVVQDRGEHGDDRRAGASSQVRPPHGTSPSSVAETTDPTVSRRTVRGRQAVTDAVAAAAPAARTFSSPPPGLSQKQASRSDHPTTGGRSPSSVSDARPQSASASAASTSSAELSPIRPAAQPARAKAPRSVLSDRTNQLSSEARTPTQQPALASFGYSASKPRRASPAKPLDPASFFARNSSARPDYPLVATVLAHTISHTTLVDYLEGIEERALEEGKAAATIAREELGEISSLVRDYLDDDGGHEAVGMEAIGLLARVDKPFLPVLFEAASSALVAYRTRIEQDRADTYNPALPLDTTSGAYWTKRESQIRALLPQGYGFGTSWMVDGQGRIKPL